MWESGGGVIGLLVWVWWMGHGVVGVHVGTLSLIPSMVFCFVAALRRGSG
jgi:hypothetical protein